MSEELRRFVTNRAVQSKLADAVVVDRLGDLTIVFIAGFPMTEKGFYILASKAIFGKSLKLPVKIWRELHAETVLLCQGLDIKLKQGYEAFSVAQGIAKAIGWSKSTYGNKELVTNFINQVEEQLTKK